MRKNEEGTQGAGQLDRQRGRVAGNPLPVGIPLAGACEAVHKWETFRGNLVLPDRAFTGLAWRPPDIV